MSVTMRVDVEIEVADLVDDHLDEVLAEIPTKDLEVELERRLASGLEELTSLEARFSSLIDRGAVDDCHRELDEWIEQRTCRVKRAGRS